MLQEALSPFVSSSLLCVYGPCLALFGALDQKFIFLDSGSISYNGFMCSYNFISQSFKKRSLWEMLHVRMCAWDFYFPEAVAIDFWQ